MGWLWSLLGLAGRLLSGKLRREATVDEAEMHLIETLREELVVQRSRCDVLQRSVDQLIAEVGALKRAQFEAELKLAACEARHAADAGRIAELEARVAELSG